MKDDTVIAIVFVEDSVFFADLAMRILKRNGMNARCRLVSTRTALQIALTEEKWDIIISDNVMPEFCALGALEVRNEICDKTPFVIVSEDITAKELKEAFDKGGNVYLPKEKIMELPELIRQVLQKNAI